ncbi:metal-dependent hydrolase [Acinetobacter sp. V91_7]|uniref:metal-dependent hydrolase n=1 Tax=unclassified Acinetobacter TaxID=196816 RepID=UPI00287C5FF5|nr:MULTISPECIES: metal-dependent hydrolase [unclassified Acinetobacter]MDS7927898.1 metal-dependent hydrolase [Acinetobacter sp. V102_4]MDS7932486.1 metal-dependent hydrolase [Acinetobacter sp. V91_4B]MDS7961457.1 metal-dependent hydrolase [Acinetobacter sp. V91_7]MDS8025962.1 metal-dependent hydrolase [Acinetobacter sp. V91_13]
MNRPATNKKRQNTLNQKPYEIKPSTIQSTWGESTPDYWFADNPFLTHFMNAFSGILPQGEYFMIASVRSVRHQVQQQAQLNKDISGFIGQEAHHAKIHQSFNRMLEERGLPVQQLEKLMMQCLKFVDQLSEQNRMAVTGATEHFTALFGKLLLSHPEIIEQIDSTMKRVMIWHALEELEHKAVAYDVYQLIDGGYWRRVYGVLLATGLISGTVLYGQASFLWADKSIWNLNATMKGLWWMFGVGKKAGYFRKALPDYLEFFKPNFHPMHDDNSALIEQWKPILDLDNV